MGPGLLMVSKRDKGGSRSLFFLKKASTSFPFKSRWPQLNHTILEEKQSWEAVRVSATFP